MKQLYRRNVLKLGAGMALGGALAHKSSAAWKTSVPTTRCGASWNTAIRSSASIAPLPADVRPSTKPTSRPEMMAAIHWFFGARSGRSGGGNSVCQSIAMPQIAIAIATTMIRGVSIEKPIGSVS